MVTVGEVAEVVGGSTPSTRVPSYWGGDICWATPTDITGLKSRYISETATKITEEGLKSAGLRLLPPRSILVTSRATVGACAISTVPVSTNQGFASLVCKDGIEPEFLYYHISARQRELARLSAGSTFTELPRRGFRKLLLLLPPLPEQRKIARILSSVDDAIERTEAVIEQVRRVKQGLAQQLLTRGLPGRHTHYKRTEVGEIPACWEVVRLDSITREIVSGFASGARDEDGIVQLRMNNLTTDGRILLDEISRVPIPADVGRWTLKVGDLLFNNTNSIDLVGKSAVFAGANFPCTFSNHLTRIRFKPQLVSPGWVLLWFTRLWSNGFFRSLAIRHVGQAAIYGGELRRIKVPLPPVGEQQAMLQIVQAMDERIEAEREVVERLRAAKSALMHVLLTGQVRVRVQHETAKEDEHGPSHRD